MSQALFVTLGNLQLDPPGTIDLGNSRILPLKETEPEIQSTVNLGLGSPHDFRYPMPQCDYVLQTTGTVQDCESAIMRALSVFRLFKDSQIVCEMVVVGHPPIGAVSFRHLIPWSRDQIDPYRLLGSEQASFARFWNRLAELDSQNFAVYRFALADFRPYMYDRFTDYVESMEYLFVPDSAAAEIRHKLSSRAAMILGQYEAPSIRQQIYEEMKDAYDIRSSIVHGTVTEERKLRLGERRLNRWEDANRLLRHYDREGILFFFNRACLGDPTTRRELLERMLIFDSRIVE